MSPKEPPRSVDWQQRQLHNPQEMQTKRNLIICTFSQLVFPESMETVAFQVPRRSRRKKGVRIELTSQSRRGDKQVAADESNDKRSKDLTVGK